MSGGLSFSDESDMKKLKDYNDLLKVYSDIKAVPLFNSDNCDGRKYSSYYILNR